jgi:hypothetical protein
MVTFHHYRAIRENRDQGYRGQRVGQCRWTGGFGSDSVGEQFSQGVSDGTFVFSNRSEIGRTD